MAVFVIGFPAILVEFVIGRRTKRNPVDAFADLGFGSWAIAGALGAVTSFATLAFYSVIGGWVLSYIVGSVTGAYFGDAAAYFGSVASGPIAIAAHAVFMGITIAVVALGVTDGIERTTKVMVPAVIVLLVGLAAWAFTLPGAAAGYGYYLTPDFDELAANVASIVPAAVGQAFFTLSLGFSVMIIYSSYLGHDDSLPADGSAIVVINTLVAILAGLVVFPVLFAIGGDVPQEGGSGTAFTALASAFGQLPAGGIIGFVFFAVLLFAALSSAISLLEVPVGYVVQHYGYERSTIAIAMGVVVFLAGIPPAMGTGILGWYNAVVFQFLLPLVVLLLIVFVGWVAADQSFDELGRGSSLGTTFASAWLWWVRVVVPVGILLTFALGIQSLLVRAGVLASPIFLG